MTRAAVLVMVLHGAGCGGASPATIIDPVVSPAAPAPARYLVWTRGPTPRTRVVDADGERHRVVASTDGVLLAAADRVFRFTTRVVEVPLIRCEHDDPSAEPPPPGVATEAEVVDLVSGRRTTVIEAPRPEELAELEHRVTRVASVGSLLFIEEAADDYGCGAHGAHSAMATVFDLASGAVVELLGPDEVAALDGDERARAHRALVDDPERDVEPETAPSDVLLSAVRPSITASGVVASYLFSTVTCYACSDGVWSSYTTSIELPASALPARLAAFRAVPPAIASLLRAEPELDVGGFGEVIGEEARRAVDAALAR